MVLRSDQLRMKALLTEAIMMLCKSGLSYDCEFSIEALIGVTLDKNEIFLVNIKETVSKLSFGHMSSGLLDPSEAILELADRASCLQESSDFFIEDLSMKAASKLQDTSRDSDDPEKQASGDALELDLTTRRDHNMQIVVSDITSTMTNYAKYSDLDQVDPVALLTDIHHRDGDDAQAVALLTGIQHRGADDGQAVALLTGLQSRGDDTGYAGLVEDLSIPGIHAPVTGLGAVFTPNVPIQSSSAASVFTEVVPPVVSGSEAIFSHGVPVPATDAPFTQTVPVPGADSVFTQAVLNEMIGKSCVVEQNEAIVIKQEHLSGLVQGKTLLHQIDGSDVIPPARDVVCEVPHVTQYSMSPATDCNAGQTDCTVTQAIDLVLTAGGCDATSSLTEEGVVWHADDIQTVQIDIEVPQDLTTEKTKKSKEKVKVKCVLCGRQYKSEKGLNKHKCKAAKVGADTQPLDLTIGGDEVDEDEASSMALDLVLSSTADLTEHESFNCVCGKIYDDYEVYLSHLANCTKSKLTPFKSCEICGKSFFSSSGYIKHKRLHVGAYKFRCEVCRKGFFDRTHLGNHMDSSHSKVRRYECSYCLKSFFWKHHLKRHLGTCDQVRISPPEVATEVEVVGHTSMEEDSPETSSLPHQKLEHSDLNGERDNPTNLEQSMEQDNSPTNIKLFDSPTEMLDLSTHHTP